MGSEDIPTSEPDPREAASAGSTIGRDNTLAAIHGLEAAAGRAAPGREAEWLDQVRDDLRLMGRAVTSERDDSLRPDSLLSMIARDYPRRFGSQVRKLREEHDDIDRAIASLRAEIDSMSQAAIDTADLRQRLGQLVDTVRQRWARETDLVYEAIRVDLGRGGPDDQMVGSSD